MGTWRASPKPIELSATDLQQMCDNLNAGIPPVVPLSFGHNTDTMFINRMMDAYDIKNELPFVGDMQGRGAMALGRLANGRVREGHMDGDFLGVPDKLAAMMKVDGVGYNTTSPLVLRKEHVDDYFGPNSGIIGPVILGVALLGAENPAYLTQKGLAGLSLEDEESLAALSTMSVDGALVEGQALGGSVHVDGPGGNEGKEEPIMPDEPTNINDTGTGFRSAESDGQFSFKDLENGPLKGLGIGLQAFMDNMTAQMNTQTESIGKLTERLDGIAHESFSSQLSAQAHKWAFMDDATRAAEVERITEMHSTNPDGAIAAVETYNRVANMSVVQQPGSGNGATRQSSPLSNYDLFRRHSTADPSQSPGGMTPMDQQAMDTAVREFAIANNLDPVLQYDIAIEQWAKSSTENAMAYEMAARPGTIVTEDATVPNLLGRTA